MSIYGSGPIIGPDPDEPGAWTGTPPLTYIASHIYPDPEQHRPVSIDTASIPHWCIPGHDGEGPGAECAAAGCDADADGYASGLAPWLRLGLLHVGDNTIEGLATVVLSTDAVRALRDELDDWLARVWEEDT